jgi:hypothetical protein
METVTLSLSIHEVSGLSGDLHSLRCAATFAGRTKSTPFEVSRHCCTWNTELEWIVDSKTLSRRETHSLLLFVRDRNGEEFGRATLPVIPSDIQHEYGEINVSGYTI